MTQAFVSAGSNIGPERNIREAIRMLASRVRVLALSTVYLTEAIGRPEQPPYYNCVLAIETMLQPLELKQNVLAPIENELGRIRSADKYAARTIDLDLILYEGVTLRSDELILPDPDIPRRPFLIAALRELAPGIVLPGISLTAAEVALSKAAIKQLDAYTDLLREELRNGFRP